jgi:hypothetical protein
MSDFENVSPATSLNTTMSCVYITTPLNCLGYAASNDMVGNDLEERDRDTFNELPAGNEKKDSVE